MDREELTGLLLDQPVIAAVKTNQELEKALESASQVVFVLYGDILHIAGVVAKIKQAGKTAFVHVDLIDGLASKEIAVDFIAHNTRADGIISTKAALIRRAKACGLLSIQRFFLLDSLALVNIERQMAQDCGDLIEILPGVMPKIIKRIVATAPKPIIAGGLIYDKEDVVNALGAGAVAVSSTNPEVWFL